ncbi:MAG: hypothetical protein ACXWG1_03275 [Usitatibacter sp.]
MNAQIEAARAHPAAVISFVIAGLAVAACALVAIAYMLGWVGSKAALPSAPTSMASPGLQVAGSGPDLALLPGETLVAAAESPAPPSREPPALPAANPAKPPARAQGAPAPESARPAVTPRNAAAPVHAPAPPAPSPSYAQAPAPRAAPSRPNYTRSEVAASASYDRSLCVNCGRIASIGRYGPDWEVRVRFEDGSTETLRYPEPPRLRVGDRVHLEEGQLVPD